MAIEWWGSPADLHVRLSACGHLISSEACSTDLECPVSGELYLASVLKSCALDLVPSTDLEWENVMCYVLREI